MAARRQTDTTVLRWLVAATFVVILNETITLTAIPRLMADFGVSESTVQWLSTIFLLTMAVVIPVTGWLLQQVTTRTAFLIAMSVFSAGTLLAALAWTFPVLVVARLVQASGTAVMMPLLMTTLMAVVPPRERGRVMGNVTLAISVAPALGPAVSGLVLQVLSWRWIFLVVLPVAAVVTIGGLRRLANVGERVPSRVDWASVVLAAVGFGSLVYGLSEVGVAEDRTLAWSCLALGVAGVAAFVLRQLALQREDRPLLDLRTLRLRVYTVSLTAMSLGFLGMLGSMILLQFYLQDQRGLTPLQTGMLVMPGGLVMGLLGPRVGRLYDRYGSRVLVRPGAVLVTLGLAGFALVGLATPLWLVLILHVGLMGGLALLFTPLFTMGLGALPPHLYSHGSSLLGTCQQVAGAFGTALVVMVMASRADVLVAGGLPVQDAKLAGMHWSFAISAALGLVVLGLVSTLPARSEPAPHGGDPDGHGDQDGELEPDEVTA
jgi:DHA2 family lincomycin resistance protein-like MFS transporter